MTGNDSFADASFWCKYGTSPDYAERIAVIHSLIPPDTRSLLDIGCGKGDVVNALVHNSSIIRIIGIDPFFESMKFLSVPAARAALPQIPFDDRTFDLVMCLEVLEHLEAQDFFSALLEIQRLAKNSVIIGVPYKENLQTLQVQCSNCRRKSHAYGHVRSFQKKDMSNLLPGFVMEKSVLTGVRQHRHSVIGTFVEHYVAGLFYCPPDFICPYCHQNLPAVSERPSAVRWAARKFNKELTSLRPSMPYWIIALYRRKGRAD
jgi:SAM-dependent methyltransferase